MLVGIDETNNELGVGIIDYLQLYNYKRMIESNVKKAGSTITGQAEPTIIGPNKYRDRFICALDRYFVGV